MIVNLQHRITVTATSARELGDLLSQAELTLRPAAAARASGISVTRESFETYCVAVDGTVPAGETRERRADERIGA